MENNKFGLVPPKNHVSENVTNNNDDFHTFINQMLHSHDNVDYLGNNIIHDQIIMDNTPNNNVGPPLDPLPRLCDDNSSMPVISELGSSSVQVNNNDYRRINLNNNHSNMVMAHNNFGDVWNNNQYQQGQGFDYRGNGANVHGFIQNSSVQEQPLPTQVWHNTWGVHNLCSNNCQLLREIMHSNGIRTTKLMIHGVTGFIAHAIFLSQQTLNRDIDFGNNDYYQVIDLSTQDYNMIKVYLTNYLEERRQSGYYMLPEPMSPFYEALCTGYNWFGPTQPTPTRTRTRTRHVNLQRTNPVAERVERVVQQHPGETSNQAAGNAQMPGAEVVHEPEPIATRRDLAVQRERTRTLRLEDIAHYFDMPVKRAARKMNLCDTVVKNKLRTFGVPRWPYRKVKSMKKRIKALIKDLDAERPELRAYAVIEIQRIQQELKDVMSGNLEVITNILL